VTGDREPGQGPRPLPSRDIEVLLGIMAALRDPVSGCAWDRKQDFASISRYTIEEAYEVADAIARSDLEDLRDELGDLLLQVVFHARMAEERGAFDFGGVVEAITAKLIRRHPHVFGDRRDLSPAEIKASWDAIKQEERRGKGRSAPSGILDDVPGTLPALARADKLARRAASVGFTWTDPVEVLDKVEEELAELRAAIASGQSADMRDELGDVLFTVANVGRFLDISPDEALGDANRKFERRFRHIETALAADGRSMTDASLSEMEAHWDAAKSQERSG
jgi:ATP diphosphatase